VRLRPGVVTSLSSRGQNCSQSSFDILPQLAGLRGWILAVVCRADPGIDHKAMQQRESAIAPCAPQAVTMFGLLLLMRSESRT
jgi:hypothetical protein